MPSDRDSRDRAAAPASEGEVREAAIRLLARREHSVRELARKLDQRGHDAALVERVLAALGEAGLQSDRRFAESWCRQRAEKGYGPLRIRAELGERGVASDVVEQALETLEADFEANARAWYQRRYRHPPADFRERARRSQALYRRGFDGDIVRAVVG
ncbi:MAG: regulatory protein RecX [Wenzhouxiangellaceae bacterium]|nr:regulatory protein RecX [Wenzhouxiangellaceae bacterium]